MTTRGTVRRPRNARAGRAASKTEQRQFFEEMGLLFEGSNMPRMAGRLIGWLLLCDPPQQTPAQVGEVVGASKGSVSTMLRLLVQAGIVERVGVPGERSHYYRIREGGFAEHIRGRMAFVQAARELADRGLELMQGASELLSRRLQDFRDLHVLLERELPPLLKRYEQQQRSRGESNRKPNRNRP